MLAVECVRGTIVRAALGHREMSMKKKWRKPVIIKQDVALEITAYQSAQVEKTGK